MLTPDGDHEWYKEGWTCGQLGPGDHHDKLETLLELNESQEYHVIYESFEFRNTPTTKHRDNVELVSREYIGVARLLAQKYNWPIYHQTAAQGKITKKSFVRKVNLQRLGLWRSGWPHAMDGYGHLLYWLVNDLFQRKDLLAIGWPNE
jgi:hypothetical protein